jgi:hypothetical protein
MFQRLNNSSQLVGVSLISGTMIEAGCTIAQFPLQLLIVCKRLLKLNQLVFLYFCSGFLNEIYETFL